MYRVWGYLTEYSLLLIIGALTALIWANIDVESYNRLVGFELIKDSIVG